MSTRHKICLVILCIAMTCVFAQYPTNKCHQNLNDDQVVLINCTIHNNNSVFNIYISQENDITINHFNCINSSGLSDLNPDVWENITHNISWPFYEAIQFDDCNLPENVKLIDVVQMLRAIESNIHILILQSHKNLSLTLNKYHLNGFTNLEKLEIENYKTFHVESDLLANLKKLQTLSLSSLEHLADEFFDYTPNLRTLNLNNNHLKLIKPSTFNKLKNLIYLSLQNNSLYKLQLGFFDKLVALKNLDVSENFLTELPPGIFDKLVALETLDVSENSLTELPPGIFDKLVALKTLDVSKNYLTKLSLGIFDKLVALKNLDVSENSLTELPPDIFDKLVALETLDISINNLFNLFGLDNVFNLNSIFGKLKNLNTLNLNKNYFTYLEKDLLRYNTKLLRVDLSYNQRHLTLLDEFSNLTKLDTVILTNNGLVTLPENLFRGSIRLTTIILSNNYLQTLPVNLFWDLEELTTLNLDSNHLEVLPDDIFSNIKGLKYLILSNNRITSVPERLFKTLRRLEELNMERNHLKIISNYNFRYVRNLKTIKLSHNFLTLESNGLYVSSPFYNCDSLTELYLANNSISKIFDDWINSKKLRRLDLSYNNISSIQVEDLMFSSPNIIVNLTQNKIQHIPLYDAKHIKEGIRTKRNRTVKILMENNPLNCDREMYDFLCYGDKMHNVQSYFQIELENLICHSPKELEKVRICSRNISEINFNNFYSFDTTVIINISAAIALIALIIGILCYKYQTHIKIWLFKWCLRFTAREKLNNDVSYEVCLCTSRRKITIL
nr:PREDICTED: protein toll-like isoform X1 [Linepithema humile]XP_012235798.1 PREDICTED: protein toll-like isoform X1 [Linepithema humile]